MKKFDPLMQVIFILSFLTVLFSQKIVAQPFNRKGFVILNNADTIEGYFDPNVWTIPRGKVYFKKLDGELSIYTPNDILGFVVEKRGIFETALILTYDKDKSTPVMRNTFLHLLVDGFPFKLYETLLERRFFYKSVLENADEIMELTGGNWKSRSLSLLTSMRMKCEPPFANDLATRDLVSIIEKAHPKRRSLIRTFIKIDRHDSTRRLKHYYVCDKTGWHQRYLTRTQHVKNPSGRRNIGAFYLAGIQQVLSPAKIYTTITGKPEEFRCQGRQMGLMVAREIPLLRFQLSAGIGRFNNNSIPGSGNRFEANIVTINPSIMIFYPFKVRGRLQPIAGFGVNGNIYLVNYTYQLPDERAHKERFLRSFRYPLSFFAALRLNTHIEWSIAGNIGNELHAKKAYLQIIDPQIRTGLAYRW